MFGVVFGGAHPAALAAQVVTADVQLAVQCGYGLSHRGGCWAVTVKSQILQDLS